MPRYRRGRPPVARRDRAASLPHWVSRAQRSPFYVFISFHRVAEWWSYGLVKIQPVAKIPGFRNSVRDAAEMTPR